MWKVYKRTCPNGRVYIGITSKTLEERMKNGYSNNLAFTKAVMEYGAENIVSEILEEYPDYDTACQRELYYIDKFRDICYNKVGNGKNKHNSLPCTEPLHSCNSTDLPSTEQRSCYKTHIVPLTTKPANRRSCPINIYSLDGHYITTFESAKVASTQLNVNQGDIISCCKGVKSDGKPRYQAKGYVFRYATDGVDKFPDIPVACKKVNQYTMEGEYIRTFSSMKDAWLHTGASVGGIGLVCKGMAYSAGGYKWEYAEKREG